MEAARSSGPSQEELNAQSSTSSTCLHLETLEDALKHFDLLSQLDNLDKSIEDLRRHRKRKDDYKLCFEQFVKAVQKLSFKYHPDKVKCRDSNEKRAENDMLQIAINAIRTTLPFLNKIFLEDLYTDYKYGLYLRLKICTLSNEIKMKPYVQEISYKIKFMSVIRRKHIIAEIRGFLIKSKSCIKCYIENENDGFGKHFASALLHLDRCIEGYKGLIEEYDLMEEDLTKGDTESVPSPLLRMKKTDSEHLKSLEHLRNVVKLTDEGHFLTLNDLIEVCLDEGYSADEYFILPFVCYINLMIMCKMVKETEAESAWRRMSRRLFSKFTASIPSECFDPPELIFGNEDAFVNLAYYLALYYRGYYQYQNVAKKIMKKQDASPEEIKARFLTYVETISMFFEHKFKIGNYNE